MASPEIGRSQESKENPCVFCSIVHGDTEASVVEKNDKLHVIISLEGTPLVIPNKHIQAPDEDPDLASELFKKSVDLIPFVRKAYSTTDFNIISNTGKFAGQAVNHFHVHIIPRFEGDRIVRFAPVQAKQRNELDAFADLLKHALDDPRKQG